MTEPDEELRLERHFLRRTRYGVDEADPALVGGGRQEDEPAVFKLHNRRIGDCAQALGVHPADHPRLQLQKISGAEQIPRLCQTSGQRQLMAELRRICRDAVVPAIRARDVSPELSRSALCTALGGTAAWPAGAFPFSRVAKSWAPIRGEAAGRQ